MKFKLGMMPVALVSLLFLQQPAQAFGVAFASWGNFAKCTTGNPRTVASPAFSVSDVPKGTVKLHFNLRDLNVIYNHGGGTVAYSGGTVPAGAFTYQSPCPPDGAHNYQWTVQALDADGKTLAKATVTKRYP